MARNRHVCIHGHFYQPPRENPWLEAIQREESAYPYPNWNARITAECYRPNAASRIVDGDNRIIRISDNYAKISFNFGPTLLSYLASDAPDVYAAILAADRASRDRFSGHGSAMAQAYSHLIMPLASRRDKHTQVRWGIRDFEHRFGRAPEGMWLPETAVDHETLDIMAGQGIAFTVLAPGQARRVRTIVGSGDSGHSGDSAGGRTGHGTGRHIDLDVSGGSVDPGHTYRATTPSGRHIDVFFYDGVISQAVAFERLLSDGKVFAHRLVSARNTDEPLLSHIATDGETYGHHHRHGDMALAYALERIERDPEVVLTNYAEFRARFPARREVDIIERTAWSCAHGVGRWSEDCGCQTGGGLDFHQRWRRPLRDALDWLRDQLAAVFEDSAARLFHDPWAARDDYIDVILDRSPASVDRFLARHGRGELAGEDEIRALQLLELQRNAMLMYTSCGWFFNDISGPETVQILTYAARAIDLCGWVAADRAGNLEDGFTARLAAAESNRPQAGNGQRIYNELVLPKKVDLGRVIAHYAVSSLFEDHGKNETLYCYSVETRDVRHAEAGKAKLVVGAVRCSSLITRASRSLGFGVLHLGDHNLTGGVRSFAGEEAFQSMVEDVLGAFDRADLVATQRQLDRHFLEQPFSLESLFDDHRDRILRRILDGPLGDAEATYGQIYAHNAPLMRFLVSMSLPVPEAFRMAAQFLLQARMRRALDSDVPSLGEVRSYLEEARRVGVTIEDAGMDYLWQQGLERLVDRLVAEPGDLDTLEHIIGITEFCAAQRLDVDLHRMQNACYKLRQDALASRQQQAHGGNRDSELWVALFERLCHAVRIAI